MAHGTCHFLTEARSLPRETVSAEQTEGVLPINRQRPLNRSLARQMQERRGARGKLEGAYRDPAKILRSKSFVGRGGAGVIGAAFAVRRTPAKFALLRRDQGKTQARQSISPHTFPRTICRQSCTRSPHHNLRSRGRRGSRPRGVRRLRERRCGSGSDRPPLSQDRRASFRRL